jgi:hypothetical protein
VTSVRSQYSTPRTGAIEHLRIPVSQTAAIVVALGSLLLWRLARERTSLIAVLSAAILLLAAHLQHLFLLF